MESLFYRKGYIDVYEGYNKSLIYKYFKYYKYEYMDGEYYVIYDNLYFDGYNKIIPLYAEDEGYMEAYHPGLKDYPKIRAI